MIKQVKSSAILLVVILCPAAVGYVRLLPPDKPVTVVSSTSAPGYCISYGGSHTYENIQSVSWSQQPGGTLTITVFIYIANPTGCVPAAPCPEYDNSPEYLNAWIDWDGDKVFENNEKVLDAALTGYIGINYHGTMSTSNIVTIPVSAVSNTWMRVNLGWDHDPENPCEISWTWGDVVDKEIVIKKEITEPFPKTNYKCPDYSRPKNGDISKDGIPDWHYENVKIDDKGNSVDIWGVDPDGKQNTGPPNDPYDEYFAVIFNSKDLIGKCPFGGGQNIGSITYMSDSDGSGKSDEILRTVWTSTDKGSDDIGTAIWPGFTSVAGQDKIVFEFDVKNDELTVTHYDEAGNVIKTKTAPPAKPGGSWVYDGEIVAELQYDEEMFAGPEEEPLVELTGNYNDYGTDINSDGIFDYLTIEANVKITDPGYVVMKARLMDVYEEEIGWTETTCYLEAGPSQVVQLQFDGEVIYEHAIDGPYYLRDAYIYHTGDPIQSDYVYEAYTTNVYQYVQFGNRPPVADAGLDQTVEQESYEGTEVTLDGSGSTDADSTPGTNDDIVSFDWYEGPTLLGSGEQLQYTFQLGEHTVTLIVTDSSGQTDDDEVVIVVEDSTPPTVYSVSANPDVLWPPNHKMVEIIVEVDFEDICDPDSFCYILGVSSNEPINGPGDGNTEPDWEYTDDPLVVLLRAERSGGDDGRIYTIHIECQDVSGNTTIEEVEVTVPHDKGKGKKK